MSNLDKACALTGEWVESMGGLEAIRHDYGSDLSGLMQALDGAGLLMPDVQIIRTLKEVEALDSYALLTDKDGGLYNRDGILENLTPENMSKYMPFAVLVTRDHFRAAREAMEQDNE